MTLGHAEVLRQAEVLRARTAVGWIFAINGLAIATWLSRLPAIRETLGLSPSRLALILVAGALGAVLTLPTSGAIVHRLQPARTVRLAAMVCLAGVALVGIAGSGAAGGIPLLVLGLFGFGVGNALWDVAMNVEAAQVERGLGRAIMSRFHAAFSLGTVAGALLGAGAAAIDLSVAVHVGAVALGVALAVLYCVRRFLPVAGTEPDGEGAERPAGSGSLAAWREPRTLMLGLLVLGMGMAEGSANDWLAIGLVDGYDVSHAVGAAGYGVFVAAMTAARMAGPQLLASLGRVTALRASAVLVLVGVACFVSGARLVQPAGTAAALALAALGAVAWGCGAALGFPVGMSAASDDPSRAAARVSVVASLGYVAFLAGPPFLGFIGDRVGVVDALVGVGAAVVLSLICAGAAREQSPA